MRDSRRFIRRVVTLAAPGALTALAVWVSCADQTGSTGPGSEVVAVVGRAVLPDSTTPVANAAVFVRGRDFLADTGSSATVLPDGYTDAEGCFEVEALNLPGLIVEIRDTAGNHAAAVSCSVGTNPGGIDIGTVALPAAITVDISLSFLSDSLDTSVVHSYVRVYGLERVVRISGSGGGQLTVMPRGSFTINAVSSIVAVPLNLSSVVVNSVSDSIALHMPYLAPNDYTQDSLAVASILLRNHIHAGVAGVTTIDSVSGRIASLTLAGASVSVLPEVIGDLTGLRRLYLDSNQALTQVPSTIGNLLGLRELGLKACGLGTLPSSVLNLDSLEMLDVGGNHIGNILPSSLLWHWLNRNDPDWEQTQG